LTLPDYKGRNDMHGLEQAPKRRFSRRTELHGLR
jgi:hypothetical protein